MELPLESTAERSALRASRVKVCFGASICDTGGLTLGVPVVPGQLGLVDTAFLAYFDTGRASNYGTVAINGPIELDGRVTCGFRSRANYRAMHAAGRRKPQPPQPSRPP